MTKCLHYPYMNAKWSIFLVFTCCLSCQSGTEASLKMYYYPVPEEGTTVAYTYRSPNNADLYYRYELEKEGEGVLGKYFDQNDLIQLTFKEEYTPSGATLKMMRLTEYDSLMKPHTVHAQIITDDIFPFHELKPTELIVYHIKWNSPIKPSRRTILLRNRRLLGDTSIVFNGEKIDAVKIDVHENIELEDNGTVEYSSKGVEIYAKGLGMVYYRKRVGDKVDLEYQLESVKIN